MVVVVEIVEIVVAVVVEMVVEVVAVVVVNMNSLTRTSNASKFANGGVACTSIDLELFLHHGNSAGRCCW